MRKIIILFLTFIMSVSFTYTTAFAENNNRVKGDEPPKTEQKQKDTKKTTEEKKTEDKTEAPEQNLISFGPEIKAQSAILINPSTNTILFEKNPDAKMFPASTTKIMTAYLAIIKINDLDKELKASATAVDIDRDGSNMGLSEGEVLSARLLLQSLMIHSANDAANVLAEEVSGSIDEFVKLMNTTAKKLGMKNTHFCNPHGYHDDNHYTTARDMAILAKRAMANKTFAEMSAMKSLKIAPTNKYKTDRIFNTRNAMMNPYSDYSIQYRFANGIKTGHTSNAGYCFVGSAVKNDLDLIAVVFKSPNYNQSFIDTKALFEYAYANHRMRIVIKGDEIASTCKVRWSLGKDHLVLITKKDVKALLPRDNYAPELLRSEFQINKKITAPVKKDDILGSVKFYYDDELVAESDLYASRSVSRNVVKQVLSYALNIWFISALGVLVVIILVKRFNRKPTRKKRR